MQPASWLVAFLIRAMTNQSEANVRLPRLTSNPYVRCDRDLRAHPASQVYWLNVFRESLRTHFECGGLTDPDRMGAGVAAMESVLEAILDGEGRFDTIDLDLARQAGLHAAELPDAYADLKSAANDAAFDALPEVLHRLDAAPADQRWALVFREMLAGNWFDMGTVELVEAWRAAGGDVLQGHERVPERPWRWDDVEAFVEAVVLDDSPVVMLLDNAGPDTIFGAFSFARELLRLGREVRLAANDGPALNDVQVHDLRELIARAAQVDVIFGELEQGIVNTGSSMPLLDLSNISVALANATQDAGLLVFCGMGRGLESNWTASFDLPVLRVASVKNPDVADLIGANLGDGVVRFEMPAPSTIDHHD
jgi:uncharacterized protein with ATP-grasp and redox domains